MSPRDMTSLGKAALLILVLATGCASPRAVKLDTGAGHSWEYAPPSSGESIGVGEAEFKEALAELVLRIPLPLRPSHAGGLVLASASGSGAAADRMWQYTLRRDYGRWCQAYEAPADCLSLLEDGLGLTLMDRLKVALGLSLDPMHESIAQALEDTFSPTFFKAVVVSAIASWVVLAAAPEPVFTKTAAVLATVLLAYLGVDAFLAVVNACLELKGAAEQATTFQELEEAGARFGQAVGTEGGRLFVLAATMVVSRGTAGASSGLASRLPRLPRFPQAAALAARQTGVKLEAAGEVTAVALVEGQLAITLAPTAVAMTAMGPRAGRADVSALPSDGPGEWVQVNESMPEAARAFQARVTGAPRGYAYRVKAGGEEVDFDGFDSTDKTLLEIKGPNLARFFNGDLDPKWFFKGADKFIDQVRRQRIAAQGLRVRWVVAEKKLADALRKLFDARGYHDVEVIHLPQP